MDTWEQFQLTSSISAGAIHNLNPNCNLRVNDTYFLKNFKGLQNVGCADGVDRYVGANLKVSQVACPLLSNLMIEPFLFGSVLLARNYKQEEPQSLKDSLRASAGFGLSWQLYSAAIEMYYSVAVKA